MSIEKQLYDLEDRLFEVQYKRLKKLNGCERYEVTPKPAAKTPGWSLITTQQRDGSNKYELQTAAGTRSLPTNRKLWPADVRAVTERFEELEKQRRAPGGYLTSGPVGTAQLRE